MAEQLQKKFSKSLKWMLMITMQWVKTGSWEHHHPIAIYFKHHFINLVPYYNHFPIVLWLFWILSGTSRVSQYQKVKTNLDLLEQDIVSGGGICWAILYEKSAPHPRQITMTASHHSVFLHAGCSSCRAPSHFKLKTHAPEIGAENWCVFFSYQMRSGTKKLAPKINMDDSKIDNDTAEKNRQQTIKSQNYTKKWKQRHQPITSHVHTRNQHKIVHATDRRQNLVPEKSGTRSVWHTVQKSAPEIGAEICTACYWL